MDLRRAYITARFTPATLPAFFTLGDQLDYGGFENRALDPGQEYMFFILAELNSTTGVRRPPASPLSRHSSSPDLILPPPPASPTPTHCRMSL